MTATARKGDYPQAWRDGTIQRKIYERAGWRCEHCGMEFTPGTTLARTARRADGSPVVLTVHHINGDKSDVRYENLVALCQRCHLHIQALWKPGDVLPAYWPQPPEWIAKRGLAWRRNGQMRLPFAEGMGR